LALDETRLTLAGFSKGCVVLNQLIYEFHYTKTLTPGDAHMMRWVTSAMTRCVTTGTIIWVTRATTRWITGTTGKKGYWDYDNIL
jgi:hypothetical protein